MSCASFSHIRSGAPLKHSAAAIIGAHWDLALLWQFSSAHRKSQRGVRGGRTLDLPQHHRSESQGPAMRELVCEKGTASALNTMSERAKSGVAITAGNEALRKHIIVAARRLMRCDL